MKLFFLGITILLSICNLYSQEMPINGSFYGVISRVDFVEHCFAERYQVNYTDTIIRDTVYQKFNNDVLHLYIDHKYYIVDSLVEGNKYILYDFTLQKDDIFKIEYLDKEFIVTDRSQVLLENGEYKTHIKLTGDCSLEWIEGVGDIQNDFFYINQCFSSDHKYIACVTDSEGNLIYKKNNFNYSCENIEEYCINNVEIVQTKIFVAYNPFTNTITIQGMQEGMTYILYNSAGVKLESGSEATISTRHLPKGVYTLKVTGEQGEQVVKLVK
ncbi:MAG: hypothetical protein BWY22_01763 [Bacteroidetes bacterium ADurb.Bin217]|nr:MAG: hypothetical protein BWY22_01763 [Bacteroidetes bacterium ADurb.Bin217]